MANILDLQKLKVDGLITRLETDYYRLLRKDKSKIVHLKDEVELLINSPGTTSDQDKRLKKLLNKINATEGQQYEIINS